MGLASHQPSWRRDGELWVQRETLSQRSRVESDRRYLTSFSGLCIRIHEHVHFHTGLHQSMCTHAHHLVSNTATSIDTLKEEKGGQTCMTTLLWVKLFCEL